MRNRRLALSEPAAGPGAGPVADLTAGTVATLFREHHGELVRLALLMVGDLPTAEDVVQEHLLVSCAVPGGFMIGWIDHGELHPLPITQPYLPNDATLVIAW